MSGAPAAGMRPLLPRPGCWATLRRRASAARVSLASREAVIDTVSYWIQSSPAAWVACFKTITALVLLHVLAQTWFALPCFWGDAAPTRWQTTRRVYLVQIGVTCFAGTSSLHVQVRGLAGIQGIVPFPRYAAEKIRRFSPATKLLHWQTVKEDPVAWASRCLNVLEARVWARGCNVDPSCPQDWWHMPGSGLTDSKLSGWCLLGEACCMLLVAAAIAEGVFWQYVGSDRGSQVAGLVLEVLLGAIRVSALLGATVAYRALRGCTGVFTGLQWDSLLLEANVLALPLALPLLPNCWLPALLLPQQVCAFKCMFGSGVVKRRSRCPRWARSTAMDLHYETQPLPHAVSWYMHRLPHWVHAQECWIAFLIQLPVTFLQWGTWHCRCVAFVAYAALMLAISSTGSYGFFNVQVLGLAASILDDAMLPTFGLPAPPGDAQPLWCALSLLPAVLAFGLWAASACGLSMLQLPRLADSFAPPPDTLARRAFDQASAAHEVLYKLGVGHSYGPFAAMTAFRWELIFDFSLDGTEWMQLEFPYKPGGIDKRPVWMPLGHFARLDWRLWFVPLAMSRGRTELPEWLENFVIRLLEASPAVVALTANGASLVGAPPKYVRLSLWDYHLSSCDTAVHDCPQVSFSTEERSEAHSRLRGGCCQAPSRDSTGASSVEWGRWWYRRLVRRIGVYFLKDGQLQFYPEGSKHGIR